MTDSPAPTSTDTSRHAAEARLAILRGELEADADKRRKAALHFEIGALLEGVGNAAAAVKEYLAAFNVDPAFRPPLFALVRVFERRRSFKNLGRLYDAELRSAKTPRDKASALIDRGTLEEDRQGGDALADFDEALSEDPASADAALMLERSARRAGDAAFALRAMEARAAAVSDPVLKSLLLMDVALGREQEGDGDGAITALQEAAALPAARWRVLEMLDRVGRRLERWDAVAEALEGQAGICEQTVQGQATEGSGLFSVQRFASAAKATNTAAALLYDAARIRRERLDDPDAAAALLARSLGHRGDDLLLRQEHMVSCEAAGDLESSAADARALIEHGATGRVAAALHFRIAELAQVQQDPDACRAALSAALEADPRSAVATAMLDDLLLDAGAHAERVARFTARADAEGATPAGAALSLWRAGQIASEKLGDFPGAKALYERAISGSEQPTMLLRELASAAARHGQSDTAVEAITALLALDLEDEERGALLFELSGLLRTSPVQRATAASDDAEGPDAEGPDAEGPDAAAAVARKALATPAASRWAPDAARLKGALDGDGALLADAHLALAARSEEDVTAAAHLCAAARALVRSGDEARGDQVVSILRDALSRVPGHHYAVGLLEEVLRSRGEADEVVALLREAAEAQLGAHEAELSLLLAGAAAEAAGEDDTAAQTYEEAADHSPESVAPLWSLRRLAERTGNEALLLRALEALSEREIAGDGPGRATLDLGEHYDLISNEPVLAEGPLRSAFEAEEVGCAAAIAALLLPADKVDSSTRLAAVDRLLSAATDDNRKGLLRAVLGAARAADAPSRIEGAAESLQAIDEDDPLLHWTRIRSAGDDPQRAEARADAWIALGSATSDAAAGPALLLHGLRAKTIALGAEAADDAFMLALELGAEADESPAAAVALDETVEAGDDPDARADALIARCAHSTGKGGAAIAAAAGRALTAAGRAKEAVARLVAVVDAEPDDLASWEALRVAARGAKDWPRLVAACDRLAEGLEGDLAAWLLEEAGATLMDYVRDDVQAEDRLRRALAIDMRRVIAYGRVHDLLAERDDTEGLLTLVEKRLEVVDDSDELEKLYYESARLLRAKGDREAALAAIENLLMLDEGHVGGIALAVEIHVSLEAWQDAVEALRGLAGCDVPTAQKRLAYLGAADFLDKRLDDAKGALDELEKIVTLGLSDPALLTRMAEVAERNELWVEAARSLDRAAEATSGSERAGFARRAGALRADKLSDQAAAVRSYRSALAEAPADLLAAEALADLLIDPADRREMADAFEAAVRAELDHLGIDPEGLRKLRRIAVWQADRDLELLALTALAAIGGASEQERTAAEDRAEVSQRARPKGALSDESLAKLRAPNDAGAAAQLTALCHETLAQVDRLEPGGRYGVGRAELVGNNKEHAVRAELFTLGAVFGLTGGDFYNGGQDVALVAAMPGKKHKTTWVVGGSVDAPLDPRVRFEAGRQAMALRTGTLPVANRTPQDAATLLFAACDAAGVPRPGGPGRTGVAEWTKAVAKALPRKIRKAIPEVAAGLPDAAGLEAYCLGARLTSLRAGLLSGANLAVALEHVLGAQPTLETVRASAEARDLVFFWISPTFLALRRELGLAT